MDLIVTFILGIPVLVPSVLLAYRYVRRRYPYAVSCWFCGEKSSVAYDQINSWDCTYCEQYNGFTEDGDYNKPIAAQFCQQLNSTFPPQSGASFHSNSGRSSSGSPTYSQQTATNVLCENCSHNQLLKIKQLANFVPTVEGNFDLEVEAYKHHLEQVYRLCRVCHLNVGRELARQDASIWSKMQEAGLVARQKTIIDESTQSVEEDDLLQRKRRLLSADSLQVLSFISACLLLISGFDVAFVHFSPLGLDSQVPSLVENSLRILFDFVLLLLIGGTFTQILAVYFSGLERLCNLDALGCFSWVVNMLFFYLLEDSHIYSRPLVLIRLSLLSLNLALTSVSTLRQLQCTKGSRESAKMSRFSSAIDQLQRSEINPPFDNSLDARTSPERQRLTVVESDKDSSSDLPYGKMQMLRLGTTRPTEKQKDPFKLFGMTDVGAVLATNAASPVCARRDRDQRYPLLSPPKFYPPTTDGSVVKQLNGNVVQNGPTQRRNLPQIRRASDDLTRWEDSEMVAAAAAAASEQNEAAVKRKASDGHSSSAFRLRVVLGVSIVFNIVVIACVLPRIENDLYILLMNIHQVLRSSLKSGLFSS